MEIKLNRLYREIAETVHAMIPEEWEKFYFYAQISEDGGGTYFFYNNFRNKENYKYSVEIPFKYEVDEEEFERKEDFLYKLSKELRNVSKIISKSFGTLLQCLWNIVGNLTCISIIQIGSIQNIVLVIR